LDVLGVRYENTGVRVLVAECSAGFSPKDTLRARVKVKVLRNKWPRLLRYLNLTVPEVAEVEGWLVTGEKLPRSKTKLRTITVLDAKRMEQLASKYGIPWMKVRRVFAEEPRAVRLLHARGLGDIAKFFPNRQP
jgi:hypothetical protein